MKRDWDLLRKLLLEIESKQCVGDVTISEMAGYNYSVVTYHIDLLSQAGLINASKISTAMSGDYNDLIFSIHGITFDGHELLESIRDDDIWDRVKQEVARLGLSLTACTIKMGVDFVFQKFLVDAGVVRD